MNVQFIYPYQAFQFVNYRYLVTYLVGNILFALDTGSNTHKEFWKSVSESYCQKFGGFHDVEKCISFMQVVTFNNKNLTTVSLSQAKLDQLYPVTCWPLIQYLLVASGGGRHLTVKLSACH